MGMMIDGHWRAQADNTIQQGAYHREASRIDREISNGDLRNIAGGLKHHILLASLSCPWAHRTLLVRAVKSLQDVMPVHFAGGQRIEGYAMLADGPLALDGQVPPHVHQLYSATDPKYTGRVTVPLIWDQLQGCILSNDSAKIMRDLDRIATSLFTLVPPHLEAEIDTLNESIHLGLANAVYRAGLAQSQSAYIAAVKSVFATLTQLERRLLSTRFLHGAFLTESDLRLFATLVRFDAVYATHFRCTRKRLVDFPSLWAFARDIYAWPGVAETVDFDVIMDGYYLNDGNNPYGIVAERPIVNWREPAAREHLGEALVWMREQ